MHFLPNTAGRAAGLKYLERKFRRQDRVPEVSEASAAAQYQAIIKSNEKTDGVRDYLADISGPALVVHGASDLIVPPINGFTLQQHLPNAQLIVYPDTQPRALLPVSGPVPGPRCPFPGCVTPDPSRTQRLGDIPVVSGNTSVERVTIEHVTIRSGKTFAAVRTALEALVPRLDDGFSTLLRFGLADRARQELEAAATLSIFGTRDHGAILAIAGLQGRAIQYDIGNPLTASLMTRHKISAGLYAPIRVLLGESPEGEVAFEYHRPASTFGQFGDGEFR